MLVNTHAAGFEVTLGLCLDPVELKLCYSCLALLPWQWRPDGPEAGPQALCSREQGRRAVPSLVGYGNSEDHI